jgi:ferric-dicitrate binding protein FerR (iron transport regulator)
MATVVDVLTKYYNIPIELENRQMAYCEFSGTFREVSLDEVLKEIETELDYSITNSGEAILLSGKNCF